MALKPWYKVVTPREDLRDGKPLDASEFAVHLDQVRDGRAPAVYQDPERFLERTFLTKGLTGVAAEVLRRLSGEKTETSAVFNMTTQFGGGKTHSLTLLYHLANNGPKAKEWQGVSRLLQVAGLNTVPAAKVAAFVGTEFDPIAGRGGSDGTPLRKTPWGEIAFQIGGEKALAVLAEHEKQSVAPGGDVIRAFLPKEQPVLILMDELMNFVSRSRKSGMAAQLYSFLHNLSEEARGRDNMVLAVSIPASELEMSAEDQSDYERFKKLLDRVGKAVIMSAESETSEIIRRRLFEWDENAVSSDGRVLLNRDAIATCNEFGDWVKDHRQQVPEQFPFDTAREAFTATYPFHPSVLSVFERKWQGLPRFQQTRGILRLLALWVSRAYQDGFKGGHRDPLIGLGTAPLDDSQFRAAMFEQLGEHRLEAAVTTDICGKKDSHATRLDNEAVEAIRKARLHRKVATTIFFESNGGMSRAEATSPEIRLAVAEPEIDIGHAETVLEALTDACYYLTVERNRYHFSFKENLNKRYADRRANIKDASISDCVRAEIRKVFAASSGIEPVFYPDKSGAIPDRPFLTLVVLAPELNIEDEKRTKAFIESAIREHGASSRTYKSALIFVVAQTTGSLFEDARRALAWEEIQKELPGISVDKTQITQLEDNIKKSRRDLKETVWRSYNTVALLAKNNEVRFIDLGNVHSSAASTIIQFIVNELVHVDEIQSGISPNLLVRNWSPVFQEWSTKAVRDAIEAPPLVTPVPNPESVTETIVRGVATGQRAYV
ncbi:MAG: ATP-binding protein, partial [Acidobacteriota bacterium]